MSRTRKTNRTIKTCTKCIFYDKEKAYCTMYDFKAQPYDATDCIGYRLNGTAMYEKWQNKNRKKGT